LIPRANVTAWRTVAPWPSNDQVEQDLVLSRALVAMFSQKVVADQIVFRGGTALHKLFLGAGGRYSEDIDLVQRDAGPIGALIDGVREALDSWLGSPRWKQRQGRFTLYYRFYTAFAPVSTRRLKIEINTREHFSVLRAMEILAAAGGSDDEIIAPRGSPRARRAPSAETDRSDSTSSRSPRPGRSPRC